MGLLELFTQGFRSIAIVFVHAYAFPDHEIEVEKMAKEIGFTQISASHRVMPMIKEMGSYLYIIFKPYGPDDMEIYNFLKFSTISEHSFLKGFQW